MAHPPSEDELRRAVAFIRDHWQRRYGLVTGGLMRVIGGEFRSRRLKSLPGDGHAAHAGPSARSAVQYPAPRIEGAVFVDVYAGTGAVGIEALSRGAAHAGFWSGTGAALDAIRENLASLGVERRATVLPGKVLVTLERCPAGIVFLDPPYDLENEYRARSTCSVSGRRRWRSRSIRRASNWQMLTAVSTARVS